MKILITFLLTAVCLFTISATPQKQTWEYKFEYKMNEKKANELGSQGWELTAIESTSSAGIANNVPTYVFKRSR